MTKIQSQVAENLARVRDEISRAAARAGRDPDKIRLVGVTKYVDEEAARALVEAGCRLLGESRPQELWRKAEALADLDLQWHLIGHLQRNKVRRTLPLVSMIESVDSLRLLKEIDAEAARAGTIVPILLEVNVSGDEAKHGLRPDEMAQVVSQELPGCPHVAVRGLMTMAALEGGLDVARQNFRDLRELREALESQTGLELPELSMGMSSDFPVAIEEGATIVRVGSSLFEGVD